LERRPLSSGLNGWNVKMTNQLKLVKRANLIGAFSAREVFLE
jgi:hypothetical protein